MKIRIGNDIRFNLTLKGNRNYDRANIKQLRCYFVNTSISNMCFPFGLGSCPKKCHMYHLDPCNSCCGCRWHHRYPTTPCNPAHGRGPLPPNYGCCCCTKPVYNKCGGCSKCHIGCCGGCCNGCCGGCKCHPGHSCDNWHSCCGCCDFDARFYPYFRPGHCDVIEPMFDSEFRYLAPSKVLEGQNRIQTFFPAQEQFACGDYKLVVVVVMYESGWGKCDLHTYTIDYGYVVTLVDDESAPAGDLTIDVDTGELEGNDISSISMNSGNYKMNQNSELSFGSKDLNNNLYQLNIEYSAGYSTVYDPIGWTGENVQFISSNPSVLEVDAKTGKLTSHEVSVNTDVTITVTIGDITYTYVVTVVAPGFDYIGFSSETDPNNVALILDNPSYFNKVDSIFGSHSIKNNVDDRYLWIASKEPIDSVYVAGIKQSFYGPYVVNGVDLNFYRSVNGLIAATFKFNIDK